MPIRPDLAIEVMSPTNLVVDLTRKLQDYRAAEIPLIWVVHPELRMVQIHRLGQPMSELTEADVLTGGDIIPGFSVKIDELIPKVI